MLSPVTASVQSQPVSTASIGQRDARSDGLTGNVPATQSLPPQATPAPAQGIAADMLQSLRQLAELLGSREVDANDILTRLAIDFAAALGESQLPDETPRDFASRLANVIRQLPEAARAAIAGNSNLASLGISLTAFVSALADPASPAAARIVAHAEDPGAEGLKQKLQAAIDSYGQNGAAQVSPQPEEEASPAPPRAEGDAAKPAKDAAGEKAPAAQAAAPALPKMPEGAAGPRASAAENLARQMPLSEPQPSETSDAPAPQAKAASDGQSAPQAGRSESREGQPTMQVLRGFNVVVANVATKAADVLKTVAALAQQAEATQTFQPAGTALAETAAKARAAATPALPERGVQPEAAPAIAEKAHVAARAMEGRVIPLFSGAIGGEEAETVDIARLIKVAEQTMARAETARVPDMALAQLRVPDAVPFTQIPYPFVREEEEKTRRRGFGEQGSGDDEEMAGEDGEQLWHGEGDQAEHPDEPEIEERPFDAEEPLKRNPTDAERALHMYQRFGGF